MYFLTYILFGGKLGLAFVVFSRLFDWGGMCFGVDIWGKEVFNIGVLIFMDF